MNTILNNKKIRVEYLDSGALTVTDLRFGGVWKSDVPFQLTYGDLYAYNLAEHCCVTSSVQGNRMIFRLTRMEFFGRFRENPYRKPDPAPQLEFEFSIALDDDTLRFRLEPVRNPDEEALKLRFADGLFALPLSDRGGAILPCGYGGLYRLPRSDRYSRRLRYSWDYLGMPVFGLCRESRPCLFLRFPDYTDASILFSINEAHLGMVSIDPEFEVRKDRWNRAREFFVRIVPPGESYNELAKWYRAALVRENKFVPYVKKIARSPEAEKLVGSVIWKHQVHARKTADSPHTYSLYMPRADANSVEGLPNDWNAYDIFDTARENGFDRVCVYNAGWNFMGYDSGYPTRLPPNPERGTAEEFRAAAEYARKLSPDYIFSIHDNYQDVYANSPEDCSGNLCRNEDGGVVKGGIWRGGRARILCTKRSLHYAKRDIPKIVEILGRGSIYTDVFGCTPLLRCSSPEHPMTESEDLAARREVLAYLAETIGSVATEGMPADAYADIIHVGAFASFWPPFAADGALEEPPLPIPLWQLVYHDSVLNYTCEAAFGPEGATYQAFVALYNLLPTAFDRESLRFSTELRGTFTSEMVSHEFLGPVESFLDRNGMAALRGRVRTRYADGTSVEADFTDNQQATYRIFHS